MTTQTTQTTTETNIAVCLIGTPVSGSDAGAVLTAEEISGFIGNELDNVRNTGLRAVIVDPDIEERIEAAEELASLSIDVWFDTASCFSCVEANAVARFLTCFVDAETAGAFLDAHAESDDEGDAHHDRNVGL